jgi:DNA invertase Pin-like site-specific DNA recombinase
MAALLIGYARCSIDQQDLTAQRDGLAALGVAVNRVYVEDTPRALKRIDVVPTSAQR